MQVCADTLVGSQLTRGISGGQKKRLTTGSHILGPCRALFMGASHLTQDEYEAARDVATLFVGTSQLCHSLLCSMHIDSHRPACWLTRLTSVQLASADEISTGLDSSTTYHIVRCIRNVCTLRDVRPSLAALPSALRSGVQFLGIKHLASMFISLTVESDSQT